MDEKGTELDQPSGRQLTSIRSGTMCKLVGISEDRWKRKGFGKHKHRGWGERRHGHHWFRPGYHQKHQQDSGIILRRLLDLGLTKGCTFTVVQGSRHGPVLVEVRGTRVALGNGLAGKILVEEVTR